MTDVIAEGRGVLHTGDCLEVLRGMEPNSIDCIITDPPYFKVKNEAWDRQWSTPNGFLDWMRDVLTEFHRVLRPNGSLYLFASPQMSARVECVVGERFEVLNCIRWDKSCDNSHRRHVAQIVDKGLARTYFPSGERIVFAERYGADNIAKGEAGYAAKCDELRGFVFEPLRAYLDGEREAAGLTRPGVDEAWRSWKGGNGGMSSHWFSSSQWALPTEANYVWLRELFGPDRLTRPYETLRTEYETLRTEYETLRRPFTVTADVPYTDVWTFPTVKPYKGKHPCEKPVAMLRHMVASSTRPNAVVLDAFTGTGATGVAAIEEGRNFIGIELSAPYIDTAGRRINEAYRSKVREEMKGDERLPL